MAKVSRVVVTGGASFIGSHLVESLVSQGHSVLVLDDFSSGHQSNLASVVHNPLMSTRTIDLRVAEPLRIAAILRDWGCDLLYHLAADHGGRGYVETRQLATSNNFAIDNNVFQAAALVKVPRIIYASSGCVYPPSDEEPQRENDVVTGSDGHYGYYCDGLYGWAKMVGELTLYQMFRELGIESSSCRFFTAFGPRAKENHAIISFIARAFIKQPIWTVWGNGKQVRNWTYVDDIVNGMLASSSILGCKSINVGSGEHETVDEAIELILAEVRKRAGYEDYDPEILHDPSKPTGPQYRVADPSLYLSLESSRPFTAFSDGIASTVDWYWKSHDQGRVRADLERLLIERR